MGSTRVRPPAFLLLACCIAALSGHDVAAIRPEGESLRTGRFCLMALGTFKSYKIREGGPVDLVILSPEDHPDDALARVRRDHPTATVFAYLNSMDIMLSRAPEPASFWKEHESWFLHDATGARVTVRVKNYGGDLARFAMNVAEPGYHEYLAGQAVKFFKIGYDGLQLDNVETDYSYRPLQVGRFISALPADIDEERWYAGEVAMLRAIRRIATSSGFGQRDIIFNHMRAGEPERAMTYLAAVEGANAETWMDRKVQPKGKWGWKARVDLAREAAAAGKRTNLLCAATFLGPDEALFTFASYLMAKQTERNTFWYGRPYRPDEMPWFPFYDVELGPATSNAYAVAGSEVYRRDFEKGVVLVNPNDSAVTVPLNGTFLDDAFEPTSGVFVPAKGGAILTKPPGVAFQRQVLEAEVCSAPSFKKIAVPDRSAHAAVQINGTTEVCSIPATVPPGRYRVVVDGEGSGASADAAAIVLGGETRRVAFDQSRRRTFDADVRSALTEVGLKGAEAGVIVDRIVLVRLGDLP